MRRRDFIKVIAGSAAATWPLLARAQQGERARRIGVLMNVPENEPNAQARFAAFLQGMQQLGWADGRSIRIDTRWGGNDAKMRKNAAELVALAPEIIVAAGSASMGPLMQISGPCPSYSWAFPIPSEPVMSTALRDRAATLPAFYFLNTASAENGWTCLNRSHRK